MPTEKVNLALGNITLHLGIHGLETQLNSQEWLSRGPVWIPTSIPGCLKLPATSAPGEYDTSGLHGNPHAHACKKCIYIIKNNKKLIRYSLSRSAYFSKV